MRMGLPNVGHATATSSRDATGIPSCNIRSDEAYFLRLSISNTLIRRLDETNRRDPCFALPSSRPSC